MKTTKMMVLAVALALAGCSDDDTNPPAVDAGPTHKDGGTNPNAGGCEHIKTGPFVDVTGGADFKSAGAVKADHKAYRVSLPAGAASWAKFAADDKGDHVFFLGAAVMFELQDDAGKTVKPEKSDTSIKECAEVKGRYLVDLPAVGTYYLKLGPSAATSKVTLVIEEAGHGH